MGSRASTNLRKNKGFNLVALGDENIGRYGHEHNGKLEKNLVRLLKVDGKIELTNVSGAPTPYQFQLFKKDTILTSFQNSAIFQGSPKESPVSNYQIGEGTYGITIKDAKGCTYIYDDLKVGKATELAVIGIGINANCGLENGAIDVTVTGGVQPFTYTLFNQAGNPIQTLKGNETAQFTNIDGGVYSFLVKDSSTPSCQQGHSVTITANTIDVILAIDSVNCYGRNDGSVEAIKLVDTDTDNYSYKFSYNEPKDFKTFETLGKLEGLKTGWYQLFIEQTELVSGNTCIYADKNPDVDLVRKDSFFVAQPDTIQAKTIGLPSHVEYNDGIVFAYDIKGGTPGYQYSLDSTNFFTYNKLDSVMNQVTGLEKGEYIITVKDKYGCKNNFDVTVGPKFYVPNIFTPNGDGTNDFFEILNLPENTELRVYDRWGILVYKHENYDNSWDAKKDPDGTYFYEIKTNFLIQKGWIQVVR